MRSQFEDCLPSDRNISKLKESRDGNPGFLVDVLEPFRVKISKEQMCASLSLNEMSKVMGLRSLNSG